MIGEKILNKFFYNYLILNDIKKIEELVFKKFKGVGTSQYEIAENKEKFLESIKNQIENLNGKMSFYIKNYTEDSFENIISSYCEINIIYFFKEERRINVRLTTVFFNENGMWKIISMHSSIGDKEQKENEMFPIDMKDQKRNEEKIIYLSTKYKKNFLKIEEINFITYSSINRKVTFYTKNLEKFEIKRNFSDVKDKLKDINFFLKLDRGTIINLEEIKVLDLKEEKILFKNKQMLYVSKNKLKELEKIWIEIKKQKKIEI